MKSDSRNLQGFTDSVPHHRPKTADRKDAFTRTISTTDRAWVAGLFEGEGTVGIQRQRGSERLRMRFAVAMTDKDVVERFAEIIGCGSITGPNWHAGSTKPQWRWSATRRTDVLYVSAFLRPFLGVRRRAKLEESLKAFIGQPEPRRYQSEKTHCPRGHAYRGANLIMDHGRRRCRMCEQKRGFLKHRRVPKDQPRLWENP